MWHLFILPLLVASQALAGDLGVEPTAHMALSPVLKTSGCVVHRSADGAPMPDPECSPGAVNPTITLEVLRSSEWRTRLVRDKATSPAQKHALYAAYGIAAPHNNRGASQTCELDHIVPLEDGGADTIENLWPMCGRRADGLAWFRMKDQLENELTKETKEGSVELSAGQRAIARDWRALYTNTFGAQ